MNTPIHDRLVTDTYEPDLAASAGSHTPLTTDGLPSWPVLLFAVALLVSVLFLLFGVNL